MKKLSKTIFAIIAAVGFFINPALPRAWAYEPVLVYNPAGQPVFQYNYFAEGEYYDPDDAGSGDPDEYAYRAFSAAEKNALQRAGQYWVDILSPRKAPVETVIFNIMPDIEPGNAAAGVLQWFDLGDGTTRFVTPPEAVLAFGRPVRSELDAYFHAFMKIGVNRYNFDLNGQQNVMPWNLETLMIHEIGHALGINDNDNDDDDDPDTLPAQPSLFETQMNDDNPDDPGRWYFYGPKAMNVYGDGHNRPLPMEDSDHEQEKSHFGLRNTLMTHRFFRNYATFVEAELAALIDIGYEIDLRDHFGRSVYTEDNFIANNQGFFARNEAGTAYLEGQPNLTPYGLGLHVFGDGNTVYQNADILADGPGGGGIRSDGVENTIIVNPGVKVTANGARGSGLLVAYGHDSTVVNRGTIQATGPDGDAVRFDIGVNFFDYEDFDKNGYGSFAQYSYFDFASSSSFCGDPDNDGLCAEFENATDDLDGPLVASFDVTGSITGSRSAIYIGGNSHVGEINILNGASIQGRIINDYYYSGEDDQVPSKSTYLNFGLAADADGQAITGTPDPNFRFTIKDDILGYGADNTELGYEYRYTGRGLFDVALAGGQTIVSSQATIKVNNFTVASEAALLGQADFGSGRYSRVQANNIRLESGSLVGIDRETLNFGPSLAVNQNYPLIGLDLLNSGGTIVNQSTPLAGNDQPVMVGVNDYSQYQLVWNSDRTTLNFQPTAPGARNSERAGDAAAAAPLAGAVYDQGWSHILNRPWAAATRYGRLAPAAGEPATASRVWGGPTYSHTRHRASGDRDGYNLSAPGLALGVDHYTDNDILAGLAFSLAWPTGKSAGMKNEATSWTLAGYGGYELPGQVEIGAALGLGHTRYDLTRRVRNSAYEADYSSRTLRAGLSVGRAFELTPGLSLRPRLLGDYLNIKVGGYQESAGQLALNRAEATHDIWRSELLAELVWQSETGSSLGGSLGWARLSGDRESRVQSFFVADAPDYNFFQAGAPLDRDSLTVGLTASLPLVDGWAVEADYNGIFGRTTDSHSGELKAVFSF